jgi:hypothetical protein
MSPLENLRPIRARKTMIPFAAELAKLGDLRRRRALVRAPGSCVDRRSDALFAIVRRPTADGRNQRAAACPAPTAAVVGGAKVSTKIEVLTNLVAKVDKLIIVGGMANTFLQAMGTNVGKSLSEPEFHATVHQIMAAAKAKGCEIVLQLMRLSPANSRRRCQRRGGARSGASRRDDPRVGPASVAHVAGSRVPHAVVERSDGRF